MKIDIDKLEKVGNWFWGLPEEAKVVWNSMFSKVNSKSPACFGCWLGDYFRTKSKKGIRYFEDGTDCLAKVFGLKNIGHLVEWAIKNEKIWGNGNGGKMFYESFAYNGGEEKIR